jgi:hypothetical protein
LVGIGFLCFCAICARQPETIGASKECKCDHWTTELAGGPWVDPSATHVTTSQSDWVFGVRIENPLAAGHYVVALQPLRNERVVFQRPAEWYKYRDTAIEIPASTRDYALHRVAIINRVK